jgi:hypothetical protein
VGGENIDLIDALRERGNAVAEEALEKRARRACRRAPSSFGSTPHRLIHMTETPVLVVRGSLSSR